MTQHTDTFWSHALRVPAEHVETVARLIESEQERIRGHYSGQLESFHPSCRPPGITIVRVVRYPYSVAVFIKGTDIRVNLVSEALEHVIPDDLGVLFPTWS